MSETTTSTAPVKTGRKPRKKPERFCKVVRDENGVRTLTICVGTKTDTYDLLEIASDYGRGIQLTKPDGTVYHVCLDGLASACCCKGFTRHSRCKHRDALAALEAAGRL
jgi:hypothetical protein